MNKRKREPWRWGTAMRARSLVFLIIFCGGSSRAQEAPVRAWSAAVEQDLVQLIAHNDLSKRVYGEVISRLRQGNVPPDFLYRTFSHPDIRIEEEVVKRFERPAETMAHDRYRKIFVTHERVLGGVQFYHDHRSLIAAVVDSFGVDPLLLVSIAGVESKYGTNSQEFSVFNALHTVIHKVPQREEWAEREMAEYLRYCYANFVPPHSLYGSYAGAFGYGQFVPSAFNRYAVDFDDDGVRHPFEWPDVLASIANYLVEKGYDRGSTNFTSKSNNWRAILAYNPSRKYARVVLELREKLIAALARK